jgi:membrane carboxypeptidase/penicillin-binding protein PbpC
VLDERIAFWITDILSDNAARLPAFGEESILTLTRPAAAKTGTTTDWRDNWTVGYTPQLVVGVWAGNADNTPMVDVSGITGAAPIWHDMMEEALKSQPMADFVAPHGMAKMEVCAVSGLLPGTWCPRRQEWFISGQGPEAICTMHRLVPVDRRTGDLALADTPEEHLSWQVAVFLPEEAADWASDQLREVGARYFIDAREHTGGSSAVSAPGVTINRPYAGATYRLNHTVPLDSQRIEILAAATGDVALVRFYVDDALLVELPAPPYSTLWQLQAGHHSFLAVMFDRSGQAYTSQSVSISVVQ